MVTIYMPFEVAILMRNAIKGFVNGSITEIVIRTDRIYLYS